MFKDKKNLRFIVAGAVILLVIIVIVVNLKKDSAVKIENKQNEIIKTQTTITKDGNVEFKDDSKEVKLFNSILAKAKKYEDYKNCSEVTITDLKDDCEAQIKFKFSDLSIAKKASDCEEVKADEFGTVEHKKDVCYLNFSYRLSKSVEESKIICKKIVNEDLKVLCEDQYKIKFGKKK